MRLVRRIMAALTLMVVLGGGGAWFVSARLNAWIDAPGPLRETKVVRVPRGMGSGDVGLMLARQGALDDPRRFRAAVWLRGGGRPVRAGEFELPAGVSAAAALAILQSDAVVRRRLTIPEGLTSRQTVALVAAAEGVEGAPPPVPPEGSLLPETYLYVWGDSGAELVGRMRQAMTAALAEAWAARDPSLPLRTPQELLTLASIVEKETGRADERARVAGVFVNRLRRGMRLQSDPTTIYAVAGPAGRLDRPLTRADLDRVHPYNTYAVDGLPPGPIANPGRAALMAAAQPAAHDELYFVADGTGGHAFARTLAEHNRNVARWREIERARGARP